MKEKDADKWYELGRVAMIEELGAELKAQSGVFYSEDNFQEAAYCKELSLTYIERGVKLRRAYHDKYKQDVPSLEPRVSTQRAARRSPKT